jgi:hypothetical protein
VNWQHVYEYLSYVQEEYQQNFSEQFELTEETAKVIHILSKRRFTTLQNYFNPYSPNVSAVLNDTYVQDIIIPIIEAICYLNPFDKNDDTYQDFMTPLRTGLEIAVQEREDYLVEAILTKEFLKLPKYAIHSLVRRDEVFSEAPPDNTPYSDWQVIPVVDLDILEELQELYPENAPENLEEINGGKTWVLRNP